MAVPTKYLWYALLAGYGLAVMFQAFTLFNSIGITLGTLSQPCPTQPPPPTSTSLLHSATLNNRTELRSSRYHQFVYCGGDDHDHNHQHHKKQQHHSAPDQWKRVEVVVGPSSLGKKKSRAMDGSTDGATRGNTRRRKLDRRNKDINNPSARTRDITPNDLVLKSSFILPVYEDEKQNGEKVVSGDFLCNLKLVDSNDRSEMMKKLNIKPTDVCGKNLGKLSSPSRILEDKEEKKINRSRTPDDHHSTTTMSNDVDYEVKNLDGNDDGGVVVKNVIHSSMDDDDDDASTTTTTASSSANNSSMAAAARFVFRIGDSILRMDCRKKRKTTSDSSKTKTKTAGGVVGEVRNEKLPLEHERIESTTESTTASTKITESTTVSTKSTVSKQSATESTTQSTQSTTESTPIRHTILKRGVVDTVTDRDVADASGTTKDVVVKEARRADEGQQAPHLWVWDVLDKIFQEKNGYGLGVSRSMQGVVAGVLSGMKVDANNLGKGADAKDVAGDDDHLGADFNPHDNPTNPDNCNGTEFFYAKIAIYIHAFSVVATCFSSHAMHKNAIKRKRHPAYLSIATLLATLFAFLAIMAWSAATHNQTQHHWTLWPYVTCYFYLLVAAIVLLTTQFCRPPTPEEAAEADSSRRAAAGAGGDAEAGMSDSGRETNASSGEAGGVGVVVHGNAGQGGQGATGGGKSPAGSTTSSLKGAVGGRGDLTPEKGGQEKTDKGRRREVSETTPLLLASKIQTFEDPLSVQTTPRLVKLAKATPLPEAGVDEKSPSMHRADRNGTMSNSGPVEGYDDQDVFANDTTPLLLVSEEDTPPNSKTKTTPSSDDASPNSPNYSDADGGDDPKKTMVPINGSASNDPNVDIDFVD